MFMKLVIQRVSEARVVVDDKVVASIGKGLLVLVGFKTGDDNSTLAAWAKKLVSLRIFSDEAGAMNLDLATVSGEILLVSQFTLYGDCSRGNRPSFVAALAYQGAEQLFGEFVAEVKKLCPRVQTGVFGAHMRVKLENDGPVTLILGDE
jgi:D-tyrosyl-tRNA(Tyr) deacylase